MEFFYFFGDGVEILEDGVRWGAWRGQGVCTITAPVLVMGWGGVLLTQAPSPLQQNKGYSLHNKSKKHVSTPGYC